MADDPRRPRDALGVGPSTDHHLGNRPRRITTAVLLRSNGNSGYYHKHKHNHDYR